MQMTANNTRVKFWKAKPAIMRLDPREVVSPLVISWPRITASLSCSMKGRILQAVDVTG
jgi:hypothetical protein